MANHTNRPLKGFPGSLWYYVTYGGYLVMDALLTQSLGKKSRQRILRKLGWVDRYKYLGWLIRAIGLPDSAVIILESRLVGSPEMTEPMVSKFLRNLHGTVFVDIGAYHGHYCVLLHSNFRESIAVEPLRFHSDVLRRIFTLRNIRNVRVIDAAISREDGVSAFRILPPSSESGISPSNQDDSTNVEVPTLTLDSLLRNHGEISLVKVDVEGAELQVLQSAILSMPKIDSWAIEIHRDDGVHRIVDLLMSHGYRLTWIDSNHLFAFRAGQIYNQQVS